jgi:hypothetical protein
LNHEETNKHMDWMNQVSGLLQQYQGARPDQTPDTVEDDFDQFSQTAPQPALADGIAAAFRSEQTPPFGQMLGQLFSQSNGTQRASILNTLLATLGPTVLSQILSRGGSGGGGGASSIFGGGGGNTSGGGGLSDLIGLLGGGGGGGAQTQITPEQAEQISPEAVQQVAEEAEKQDPSVIDQVSDFYARQPTLVKTLGGAALTIALAKIASKQYGG